MDVNQQSEDGEWFEAVSETLAFQKEFVAVEQLSPEERLIPHVKYSSEFWNIRVIVRSSREVSDSLEFHCPEIPRKL